MGFGAFWAGVGVAKEAVGELASVSDVVAVEGGREQNIDVKLLHKRRKTAFWGSLSVGGGYRSRTDDLLHAMQAL